MTFTVLHAPCHGPSLTRNAVRHAMGLGASSIEWTEAYNRNPLIRSRVSYRTLVGKSKTDKRRGPKDNPISVKRGRQVIEWHAVKACRASVPLEIAPERWVTVVVYQEPGVGKVAHFAFHPHAKVQDSPPGNDRQREKAFQDRRRKYAAGMRVLEGMVREMQAKDYLIVVSGDLNWRGDDGPTWAPAPTFKRLGLQFWNDGLDWIAYDHDLVLVKRRTISERENGQDHPWLLATLAPRVS